MCIYPNFKTKWNSIFIVFQRCIRWGGRVLVHKRYISILLYKYLIIQLCVTAKRIQSWKIVFDNSLCQNFPRVFTLLHYSNHLSDCILEWIRWFTLSSLYPHHRRLSSLKWLNLRLHIICWNMLLSLMNFD